MLQFSKNLTNQVPGEFYSYKQPTPASSGSAGLRSSRTERMDS